MMRLFIAINFNDEIKDALCETAAELKAAARRGRVVRRENLHLTLAFIGESNRVDDILDVMEESFTEPVRISLNGAGAFKGRNGDLHWVGVENTPELRNLAGRISGGLREAGFEIEKKRFVPHITIGREIVLSDTADIRIQMASMEADEIFLMRSDRIDGRLVYSEVGSVLNSGR